MGLSCRSIVCNKPFEQRKCAGFSRSSSTKPVASSRLLQPAVNTRAASKAAITEQNSIDWACLTKPGAPAAFLPLLWSLPAWSAEDATVDAAFAAVQEQSAGSTDLLVSILAASVFTLLVVVTGGVAYLGIKSMLDDRQEKQDRDYKPIVTSSPASRSSDDEDAEQKKRVRVKREKKGFGST